MKKNLLFWQRNKSCGLLCSNKILKNKAASPLGSRWGGRGGGGGERVVFILRDRCWGQIRPSTLTIMRTHGVLVPGLDQYTRTLLHMHANIPLNVRHSTFRKVTILYYKTKGESKFGS